MTFNPIFITDPNEIPKPQNAQLVRTPPTGRLKAIITSHKLIACPTHYHARRTVPCGGPGNCPLCESGLKWRLHGYISILNTDNLAHQILEVPARTYDALAQWYKNFNTVRGLYIELTRPTQRPNGQIQLIVRRPQTIPESLPDPLPVQWMLCRIWGVPAPDQPPPETTPKNPPIHRPKKHLDNNGQETQNNNGKHTNDQSLTQALRQVMQATRVPE